ncbi:hypothetical protein IFR05_016488 [Cadophora sp. M221]|nr:hypothetical protein IFR05_016488 [Cadophora sp. M221]
MSHDTSAVLVGEADSPSRVVAFRSSAGAHAHAHDQVQMLPHRETDADEAGQREATPATTSMNLDPRQVQPSGPAPSSAVPDITSSSIIQKHSHSVAAASAAGSSGNGNGNAGQNGVTKSSPNAPSSFSSAVSTPAADATSPNNHSIVTCTPPTQITPQSPRDVVDSPASPSNTTTANPAELVSQTALEQSISTDPTSAESLQPVHTSTDGAADAESEPKKGKMIFTHTASNSIQRRRNYATTNALTDYEADLTSRDRSKQKEAVKKYLAEKVKNDWKWEWPQPEIQANLEPTKTIEEDTEAQDLAWKERDEWLSNASEDGDDMKVPGATSSHDTPTPSSKKSSGPLRFDSADGVGDVIKKALSDRKRRRKKRLADEMTWNEGLRCFVARRDAWTCARKIQKPHGTAVVKTTTRASISSGDGGSSTAIEQEDDEWEDDIEIPIAPPILPPENAMRASILPGAYNTIYDKVVVQSLTPSCPMNLKDVTRSCVQGWKRDGEWPPKATSPDTLKKKGRKMSVASLLGFKEQDKPSPNESVNGNGAAREASKDDKDKKSGSGIRRSIQKMLKLGHGGD